MWQRTHEKDDPRLLAHFDPNTYVDKSRCKNGGAGCFARRTFREGEVVGLYRGLTIPCIDMDLTTKTQTSYILTTDLWVPSSDKSGDLRRVRHYIDAYDVIASNDARFINQAHCPEKVNVAFCQLTPAVYPTWREYIQSSGSTSIPACQTTVETLKTIWATDELLVDYFEGESWEKNHRRKLYSNFGFPQDFISLACV